MNRPARLSAIERRQIIDDFKADMFGGRDLEPGLRDRIGNLRIELPDDPTPGQVDAWIELAGLVQDPGFRARMRDFLTLSIPVPGRSEPPGARVWWARQVVNTVATAREDGIHPAGPAAAELVSGMFGDTDLPAVLACLEAGLDADAEHYRELVSRVRGQRGAPDATEELRWLATALRTATAGAAHHRTSRGGSTAAVARPQ